jgi:hypothetical protein
VRVARDPKCDETNVTIIAPAIFTTEDLKSSKYLFNTSYTGPTKATLNSVQCYRVLGKWE